MTDQLEIQPGGPVRGSIRPPGSKSITNRALVCAALARGQSLLSGALDCDDTRVMVRGLRQLGLELRHDRRRQTISITGCGGRPPAVQARIMAGNSGTTVRFLTALVTLGRGDFRLDGTPRMRQRPIEDLLAALRQLGADATSESGTGCPPVVVRAAGLRGGVATVAGNISSQFLSAVLMAAPGAQLPTELAVSGELVSQPYVEMTLGVMAAFGVIVQRDGTRFRISPACYHGCSYQIEPDASAASYFLAAAAITGGSVTVQGLSRQGLQGDVAFCDCLERMGCQVRCDADGLTVTGGRLRGIEIDMNAISDTVPTLAAVALFADGPTTIRGVAHIRRKESDRIGALATELRRLGATVQEYEDGLRIVPGELRGATLDTYDDHRLAMSLALVGLATPGVVIKDPGCTAKTYPAFFADLGKLAGR
jgi:3-phosphoshikimate 1-carboxyvinyltransferase